MIREPRYHSPFILRLLELKLNNIEDFPLDILLLEDLIYGVIFGYCDSHALASEALINIFISEELKPILPLMIINVTFS